MTVKKILLVFIVALTVRTGYAWVFIDAGNLTNEDQAFYIQLGQNIARTGEFLKTTGDGYITADVTSRVPGYPQLLAVVYTLFDDSNIAVVAVQILIDSLTCIVIGLIAESVIVGGFLIAGLVSAMNIGMIILSGMILTDTLFLFIFSVFTLSAFKYLRKPSMLQLFLTVFFLSISALVRPTSYYLVLLLLPILVGWHTWKRRSFIQLFYSLSLSIVVFVIIFGGIHHRNYQQYDSFSLVSQGGRHLLYWVLPATYQYSGQGSYQDGQKLAQEHFDTSIKNSMLQNPDNNPFKENDYYMQVAKEALSELGLLNILHAWSAGTVINLLSPSIAYAPAARAMKHPSFYETPGDGTVNKLFNYVTNTDSLLYLSIITIGTIISMVFLIISVFGFYRMKKFEWVIGQNREILLFSLFVIIYFMAITGPIVGVKYRLPLEPIMTMFFSYALVKFSKNYMGNK